MTNLLILATCLISFLAFENRALENRFIFRPEDILAGKQYYRLVTSAFLHSGWMHLLLNMYTLHGFGGMVERQFGPGQFLLIYFGGVVGGDLLSLYLHRHHDYAAYGASGGVCGLIFAYVLAWPHMPMSVFPFPYAVPAWLYAILFLAASFYAMKRAGDNIGHDAHIGGAVIGLAIAAALQPHMARQHWLVLFGMLLAGAMIFAYVYVNPMFLPLSAFSFAWPRRGNGSARAKKPVPHRVATRPPANAPQAVAPLANSASDWLIEKIEAQVGPLHRDETGEHDWIDKFGRNYHVIGGRAESFDLHAFTAAVLDHLDTPAIRFVIVDTRQLKSSQVALLRPFIADLPEAQFNRLIRSYGLDSR